MKEEEVLDEIKENNRIDLLEPLVEEKKQNISPIKKFQPGSLAKSVNVNNHNDFDSPSKNPFSYNSIDPNYSNKISNDPINRIRKEIGKVKKDSQTEISNYSNIPETGTLKLHNFIYIIIVTIFSSLQYGIYLFIFNLYSNAMNLNTGINTMQKRIILFFLFGINMEVSNIFYNIFSLCNMHLFQII